MARKVYFANIYCNSIHYPAIDYLIQLVTKMDKDDKIILCFWDKQIYNFQDRKIGLKNNETIKERTKKIVNQLRSILSYYNKDSQVIFLSDAFSRLSKNEELFDLLNLTLGKLNVGYLEDMYQKNKYLALRPLTISKVMYMVADFIIALGFNKLYPELNIKQIDYYYTGERFKAVYEKINESISEQDLLMNNPSVVYAPTIPIISYENGKWISIGMPKSEITNTIMKSEFKKEIELPDFEELFKLIARLLSSTNLKIFRNNSLQNISLTRLLNESNIISKEDLIATLTENLNNYLEFVEKNMISLEADKGTKKITYVKTPEQLKMISEFLNPAKMEILSLCDGKHTIKEIIEKSSMKPSSVQSYISRLRTKELLSKDNKPKKQVNEILISFD